MDVPSYVTLQQCDQVTVQNMSMPYMTSLNSCMNRVVGEGYTESFERTSGARIKSKKTGKIYASGETRLVNFFRFEGNTNPVDNVIMYIIETVDGLKGTLVSVFDPVLFNDLKKSSLLA